MNEMIPKQFTPHHLLLTSRITSYCTLHIIVEDYIPFLLGKYDTRNLPQVSSGTCERAVVLKNLTGLKERHYQQLKVFVISYSIMDM